MFISSSFWALAANVAALSEVTTPSTPTQACGTVASLLLASETSLPAKVAHECLQSVPVDITGNEVLIDELKLVWQWQSEIKYLENPPESWKNGLLFAENELDNIRSHLTDYSSEYAVQQAIQSITVRSRNYHWNYEPDILTIFTFTRPVGVASVSSDGKSLPKLYVDDDITLLSSPEKDTRVSEIVQINGEEAYQIVDRVSALEQQFIDADGRLNKMFTTGDTGSVGQFERYSIYEDDTTTLEFANGTVVELQNTASLTKFFERSNANITDFAGVTDGQSFFDTFCTGLVSGKPSDDEKSLGSVSNAQPGHPDAPRRIPHNYHDLRKRADIPESNYSYPVVESNSSAVAGYFLHTPGYEDVAVLKIITFDPLDDPWGNNFQATINTFLELCIKEQKQKLVIDLRENGGGATHLLLDAFMQLFPGELPFSGQWNRATEEFSAIGDAVSEIYNSPKLSGSFENSTDGNKVDLVFKVWAYWNYVTVQNKNFASWDEFKGPHKNNGDLYTTVFRYNLSNENAFSIRPPGFAFLNYTSKPQPFASSNIVMFTDALCGSACASFHEELKVIAGVQSVAVGGRPRTGPLQAVTGTKGGEVIPINAVLEYAATIVETAEQLDLQHILNNTRIEELASVSQLMVRAGNGASRVQIQDQLRKGDRSMTPLQYIYEAADCRVFYTSESWREPEAAWRQAWDAFVHRDRCVEGSTGLASSISGGFKPFGPRELTDAELSDGERVGGCGSGSGTAGGNSTAGLPSPAEYGGPVNAAPARDVRVKFTRWTLLGVVSGFLVASW
ncbi:hypothetical protein K491DRAFT_287888 [Lophiostoma macrostomum CBS 122681]|uniref:Uncharacterized protein n=1 Tax=Lophiostoma macrostomum CBS 122681 TaxID=1314788 RepID=A0A6A6TQJ7_9PLEO|nr:hypothetical protein K491DRAFT_287888 [Lophiostoma macrostomum CBS 122681]